MRSEFTQIYGLNVGTSSSFAKLASTLNYYNLLAAVAKSLSSGFKI